MTASTSHGERLRRAIDRRRLVDTVLQMVAVPSRTGEAGAAADRLAELLRADGFPVERPEAGHAPAPAVVARFDTGRPGRTLQLDGHLDTVHLPFVPPAVADGRITGSGSADMKGGIAAAVEALRVLRDTGTLPGGGILLTAHDLHETPWGDGSQLNRLIADGCVGDGVLLPEYLNDRLPVIGRGGLIWKVTIRRQGPPVHEVLRPADEPDVIAAGADLVTRLRRWDRKLATRSDPLAGRESVFVGQVHSGEIFNQYPQECRLEGTLRWLPGTASQKIQQEFRKVVLRRTAATAGADLHIDYHPMRDAFRLDESDPLVSAFQEAHEAASGRRLPVGAKPFCDDGNAFWALAGVPAITHGPLAGGAHTLNEWVSIDDLERVALVYALTAVAYCAAEGESDHA
jgi:acetylornithine deacetylase/succinyl-diaminopimelate desuccinylase-like protein